MTVASVQLGADGLTEIQRAVSEHFREGGSVVSVLLVLTCTAAIVVLAYGVTRRQQQRATRAGRGDPRKLYQQLLQKLDLTNAGRRLLRAVAKDLQLKHATALLLSPTLFDRNVEQWQAQRRRIGRPLAEAGPPELVAEVRGVLFPGTGPGATGKKPRRH